MSGLRVAALQIPHGATLEANLAKARDAIGRAREQGARLAVLPEYWFATGPPTAEAAARVRGLYARESRDVALVGNVIEPAPDGGLLNVGLAYEGGALVLEQRKAHPMPREAAAGVVGGDAWRVAPLAGVESGLLVCADILYPEAARVLQLMGARLLLNPVMSPWRAHDDTKDARSAVYVARAFDAGAFVVKAGGFRRPGPDAQGGIAGRSLVAAPWGLLAHAHDDFAEEILVAELDLDRLEAYRKHQQGFPSRRPSAYQELVRG